MVVCAGGGSSWLVRANHAQTLHGLHSVALLWPQWENLHRVNWQTVALKTRHSPESRRTSTPLILTQVV